MSVIKLRHLSSTRIYANIIEKQNYSVFAISILNIGVILFIFREKICLSIVGFYVLLSIEYM